MEQLTSLLVILYIIGTLTSLGNLLFIHFPDLVNTALHFMESIFTNVSKFNEKVLKLKFSKIYFLFKFHGQGQSASKKRYKIIE